MLERHRKNIPGNELTPGAEESKEKILLAEQAQRAKREAVVRAEYRPEMDKRRERLQEFFKGQRVQNFDKVGIVTGLDEKKGNVMVKFGISESRPYNPDVLTPLDKKE